MTVSAYDIHAKESTAFPQPLSLQFAAIACRSAQGAIIAQTNADNWQNAGG